MQLIYSDTFDRNKNGRNFPKFLGCNQHVELTLKGILKKTDCITGHLGTNNAEFEVLEILKIGKVISTKWITNE